MIRKISVGLFCLMALMTSACLKEKKQTNEVIAPSSLQQPEKVLDYISLSAHFLINQQQSDGFFKYEYDFITGNYTYWDNIIHQARAGYTLMQYYIFLVRNNIDTQQASIVLSTALKALNGYISASVSHNDMPGQLISFYYSKSGISTIQTRKTSEELRQMRLQAEISATAFALMTEISYWSATSDNSFAKKREEWKKALIYHAKKAIENPSEDNPFMPYIWQAFAIYNQIHPKDTEIAQLLTQIDSYFLTLPRYMDEVEDYTWDMIAANQRYQVTKNISFADFAARQTTQIIKKMYTQHDTMINSCALSLGLVEASLILTGKTGDYARLEQTALGRSQLEYYSSLKYTLLPNQTWIALGPGRIMHSQDFKRFAGASLFGIHIPKTNIGLVELCLLTGMRFSNEDIKELKKEKDGY